jgi:hypothetical protein
MKITTATIARDSPRYRTWLDIFGTDTVRIEWPVPHTARLPGIDEALVYKVHVPSLTRDQRRRLIAHIAAEFGETPEAVEEGLDEEEGLPILAEDVTVLFDGRLAL